MEMIFIKSWLNQPHQPQPVIKMQLSTPLTIYNLPLFAFFNNHEFCKIFTRPPLFTSCLKNYKFSSLWHNLLCLLLNYKLNRSSFIGSLWKIKIDWRWLIIKKKKKELLVFFQSKKTCCWIEGQTIIFFSFFFK